MRQALTLRWTHALQVAAAACLAPIANTQAQVVDGAQIYANTCTACHQANGQGLAGKFPPLAGSSWATGDESRLIRIVLHGLSGEIDVEGELFNGAMPAWGPTLNDDAIAAVATYVRRSWGNSAGAVSVSTVASVRAAHAARTVPWTAGELSSPLEQALPVARWSEQLGRAHAEPPLLAPGREHRQVRAITAHFTAQTHAGNGR